MSAARALLVVLVLTSGCVPRVQPTTPEAWQDVRTACRAGSQLACHWVGVGEELDGDDAEAASHFEQACNSGVAHACAGLARLLESGRGTKRDLGRALELNRRACDAGSATGCHQLGRAFLRGAGVPADPQRSTELYAQACRGGEVAACVDHADAVHWGRGAPKDVAFARAVWKPLCPAEDLACHLLAWSLLRDAQPVEALKVAKAGCRAGGRLSCEVAGVLLRDAGRPEEAERYLRTGCTWGAEASCAALGVLVERHDAVEAEELLLASCGRGGAESCYQLAELHRRVRGETPEVRAEYERACTGGWRPACEGRCGRPGDEAKGGCAEAREAE